MKSSIHVLLAPLIALIVAVVLGRAGILVFNQIQKAPRSNTQSLTGGTPSKPEPKKMQQVEAPQSGIAKDEAASIPPVSAPKGKKPPEQNPAARAALSLVGVDPTAELVWMDAINNPALPKHERQDLIEDLNEDGFSNRKQPTVADLPLINARLAIIDRLMPEAMDKTNADALAEARKDLINMQAKLSR